MTPKGIASPHFKTGRHSKYLPAKLAAKYIEAETDEDLLRLHSEIALVDVHIAELLEKLDGEGGDWAALVKTWGTFKAAIAARNAAKQQQTIRDLDEIIEGAGGSDITAVWAEILTTVDTRRKLVESERRRLTEMHNYISAQQAMTLIGAVIAIIKANVTDRETLQSISHGIEKLIDHNPGE